MKATQLQHIWQVPVYLPYLQPALTKEVLEEAEQQLGCKLPAAYVELLQLQNGGYIRYTLAGTMHGQIYGIGPYFPSVTDVNWTDYEDTVGFQLEGLIPFDGDGHWYLCFDYRLNPSEPSITFIDTESDHERRVAINFSTYLDLLIPSHNEEYVWDSPLQLEKSIDHIGAALGIVFEEPDWFAHGYPVYRSRFKENWIWVSPNLVPKGFIRKDEPRYYELIHLTAGHATRFPGLKENSLLISTSTSEIDTLTDRLRQHCIQLQPISEMIKN